MTLNQAITKVISNQYKKNAKEAHQIVEDAGYKIEKYDGHYRVINEKLHRYCYMVYSGHYSKGDRWVLYWGSMGYGGKEHYGDPANIVFDYERMLNTPYNHAGHTDPYNDKWNKSAAMEKYVHLKHLKDDVQRQEIEMASIIKQMEGLQKRLINVTESKVKCITDLSICRKEYGLKEEK